MDTRALATWKKLWEGARWENGPMFRWSMSDLRNPAVTDWERWTSCFLRKKMIQKKCTQGFAGAVICWVVCSFAMHSNTPTPSLHQNRKVTRLVMNLLHARHHLNIHYQKHNPFENVLDLWQHRQSSSWTPNERQRKNRQYPTSEMTFACQKGGKVEQVWLCKWHCQCYIIGLLWIPSAYGISTLSHPLSFQVRLCHSSWEVGILLTFSKYSWSE